MHKNEPAHIDILKSRIQELETELQGLYKELQKLEDEEFKRTGVFRIKTDLDIKITQEEMESDLVKRTEGKTIKPAELPPINEN